jgi:hypothetical protein
MTCDQYLKSSDVESSVNPRPSKGVVPLESGEFDESALDEINVGDRWAEYSQLHVLNEINQVYYTNVYVKLNCVPRLVC